MSMNVLSEHNTQKGTQSTVCVIHAALREHLQCCMLISMDCHIPLMHLYTDRHIVVDALPLSNSCLSLRKLSAKLHFEGCSKRPVAVLRAHQHTLSRFSDAPTQEKTHSSEKSLTRSLQMGAASQQLVQCMKEITALRH